MAFTAATTVVPSGNLTLNQRAKLQITVTNGNSTPASLTSVYPYSYPTQAGIGPGENQSSDTVIFGQDSFSTGTTRLIGASGSASNTLTFAVDFINTFASTAPAYSSQAVGSGSPVTTNTISLGCICYFSDGTSCQATESTVTVVAPVMFNGR